MLLQTRMFWLSRVPALVPASASAVATVLQIRRFCRDAGFADMHVLQIRRFCLSRVPAFVPASASAVIADCADCEGVRR